MEMENNMEKPSWDQTEVCEGNFGFNIEFL